MSKPFRRNILLVCEGENTEPAYFRRLRILAYKAGIWDYIDIRPKPKEDDIEEIISNPSPHKSPRKKRRFQPVEKDPPVECDEDEQRLGWQKTPVRYVKEARDGLKDETYEEAWAIFDKNGHPAHEQAFQLAAISIGGKIVHIAFSSISFETWILLHFEKNATPFSKASCKISHKEYLNCGTGEHELDCWGKRCVSGYLRAKQHCQDYSKSQSTHLLSALMDKLTAMPFRQIALENAAWLRRHVNNDGRKYFELNPFTNIDLLVRRLLGEDERIIEWAEMGEVKEFQGLRSLIKWNGDFLQIELTNLSFKTRVVSGVDIGINLKNLSGEELENLAPGDDRLLEPGKSKVFAFHWIKIAGGDFILEILNRKASLLIEIKNQFQAAA